MTHAPSSSLALLRSMMQSLDAGIEDAIDAHGFSLSALTADGKGALLHFITAAPASDAWHLTLDMPPDGRSRVALRRGEAEAPSVSLTVSVTEGVCRDLPAALALAMDLFTAVGEA